MAGSPRASQLVKRKKFSYAPFHQSRVVQSVRAPEAKSLSFRFMHLPRELRDLVYGCLVGIGHVFEEFCIPDRGTYNRIVHWDDNDCCKNAVCPGRATPTPSTSEYVRFEGCPIRSRSSSSYSRSASPPVDRREVVRPRHMEILCQLSREFREETLKLYYAGNAFEVDAPMGNGPEILQEWVGIVGMQHLRHIFDLTATFHYHKGFFDSYHVKYDAEVGMVLKVQQCCDWDYPPWVSVGVEHITAVEETKKAEGWDTTGVLEFFILDPDAVRRILWGPPLMVEDEDEEINERDAYQVAYGRRLIQVMGDAPW